MIVRYIKSIYRANVNQPIRPVKIINLADFDFMQKSPFSKDVGMASKKLYLSDNIFAAWKHLSKSVVRAMNNLFWK